MMASSQTDPDFEVRNILRHYPDPYGRLICPAEAIREGFSAAKVWRLETTCGMFCLRAMDADNVNLRRLAGLHRLLRFVRDVGITEVSVPVVSGRGKTFVAEAGRVWQLEPWMPGGVATSNNVSVGQIHSAMQCLARWHLAAARFQPTGDELEWFFVRSGGTSPGLQERLNLVREWSAKKCARIRTNLAADDWREFAAAGTHILRLFEQLKPDLERLLQQFAQRTVPMQPCWRDIWRGNVLFTGDDVSGLIDAHSCRSDCVATDIARLAGSLLAGDGPDWQIALKAYEKIRPLSLDEQALIPVFDRSAGLLNGLTWLEWRYERRRIFVDRDRAMERLDEIVRRMERLAAERC